MQEEKLSTYILQLKASSHVLLSVVGQLTNYYVFSCHIKMSEWVLLPEIYISEKIFWFDIFGLVYDVKDGQLGLI